MTGARFFALTGYEQTALPFMGRVYKIVPGSGKTPIVRADIASISLTVRRFNTVNGGWGGVTTTQNAVAISVAGSVYDTLQTDNGWNADTIGYNFAYTIPAAAFPGLGEYAGVISFVPSGSNFSIFPLILKPITILSLQGVLAEG